MNITPEQQNSTQKCLSELDFDKTVKLIRWRLERDNFLHTQCDSKQYDRDTYLKIFWYEKGHIEGIEWALELLKHPENFIFDTEENTEQGNGTLRQ